jgi:hypothetical protein
VSDKFKTLVADQVVDIFLVASKEVIEADNIMAFMHETITKVGTQKARTSRY